MLLFLPLCGYQFCSAKPSKLGNNITINLFLWREQYNRYDWLNVDLTHRGSEILVVCWEVKEKAAI